jgi:hypothetical protein
LKVAENSIVCRLRGASRSSSRSCRRHSTAQRSRHVSEPQSAARFPLCQQVRLQAIGLPTTPLPQDRETAKPFPPKKHPPNPDFLTSSLNPISSSRSASSNTSTARSSSPKP